jgi:polysaccharide export outer membrane protein
MKVRSLFVLAVLAAITTGCGAPRVSQADTVPTQDPAPAAVPGPSEAAATEAEPGGPSAPADATLAPPPAPPIVVDEFRIGAEDILDVQVWKNAELSRVVPVRPDGKISLPLVNDIQAAGLTASELRVQVTQRLSEFIPSPEVSVIVREVHSPKVSVVGNVKMPGHYELKSAATVLDLLARAQGLTEFADRGRIVVLRQNGTDSTDSTRIPFNYSKVANSEQENFYVRPGDVIVVP